MNTFKQKRAVAECKRMRKSEKCRRTCMHWQRGEGQPFCKDAFAAERRSR